MNISVKFYFRKQWVNFLSVAVYFRPSHFSSWPSSVYNFTFLLFPFVKYIVCHSWQCTVDSRELIKQFIDICCLSLLLTVSWLYSSHITDWLKVNGLFSSASGNPINIAVRLISLPWASVENWQQMLKFEVHTFKIAYRNDLKPRKDQRLEKTLQALRTTGFSFPWPPI